MAAWSIVQCNKMGWLASQIEGERIETGVKAVAEPAQSRAFTGPEFLLLLRGALRCGRTGVVAAVTKKAA
ncbi:hypothetical protein [Bradyrhizobium erythrophlei]|uniref:Uncharacterized protein n=1 Tax=Bradyrhizobium erythrophlei TaxID=1437360 RepID=A0A1H5IZW6_9BRAD|nr:hypothetical protein [Bradyrhizobium erythrophlei]SEE45823.1 hypothetical protein SAMN05444164_8183 [Bradyrhizobium erythrophlei]